MNKSTSTSSRATKVIRWITRILSALFIAAWLFIFLGEALDEKHSEPISGKAVFELTICFVWLLGLALAWRWELFGGATALAAFVVVGILNPKFFVMPPLLVVPFTALLFLVCWWMDRKHEPRGPAAVSIVVVPRDAT